MQKEILSISPKHPFSKFNLPYGICQLPDGSARPFSRIGDFGIDLLKAAACDVFKGTLIESDAEFIFSQVTLNSFMALGPLKWKSCRNALLKLVSGDLILDEQLMNTIFIPLSSLNQLLPITIPDYTDFYASMEHAINVGTMFRGKDNALMPNWTHMPIGYHGRSSSVVVSGAPVYRPKGQIKLPDQPLQFKPTAKLDFELEMAFVVGVGNDIGEPIAIENADDHIFGVVILNDWSARDIQAWEYVPLGPFLGKSFCSSISPWIVTLDALKPFQVDSPQLVNPILPHLQDSNKAAYDINLEVVLKVEGQETTICKSNLKYMYWSFRQQLVHHTSNGCNMRTGDLCGTGTISGPTKDSYGSLLELTWNGQNPILMPSGSSRMFLQDGDSISMSALCDNEEFCVGFGSCEGMISPPPTQF